jgi:hypothetical protein
MQSKNDSIETHFCIPKFVFDEARKKTKNNIPKVILSLRLILIKFFIDNNLTYYLKTLTNKQ